MGCVNAFISALKWAPFCDYLVEIYEILDLSLCGGPPVRWCGYITGCGVHLGWYVLSVFCQWFGPAHTCVIIVISFCGLGKLNMWKVWYNIMDILNHFSSFIGDTHFGLAGAEDSARFPVWLPNNSPPIHQNIIKTLIDRYLNHYRSVTSFVSPSSCDNQHVSEYPVSSCC